MSYTAFSQSLTPRIRLDNSDTLFCFTIPQAKVIAKELLNSRYGDSLIIGYKLQAELSGELILIKDSIIQSRQQELINLKQINGIYITKVHQMEIELKLQKKKLKKARRVSFLLGTGLAVIGIIGIAY